MNYPMTTAARRELNGLQAELATLSAKDSYTRSERKRIDALLGRVSTLKYSGVTEAEAQDSQRAAAHEQIFRSFLAGNDVRAEIEQRADLLAGSGSLSYTQGAAGGMLVPASFMDSVTLGLAAVNPLLDPDVATVVQEKDFQLRPLQIPGWDLSTCAAVQVGEAVQHNSDAVPGLSQKVENKYTYRFSLGASMEFEEDSAIDPLAAMGKAFGVAFARGIGADLVNGNGTTAPQGVLTGAANSGYTTFAGGSLTATDFTAIYFAVNKIYRDSDKCAWLMNDKIYQQALNAKDSSGRPLITIAEDYGTILGKPVRICPSLPFANGSAGGIMFGDLSHYVVHQSALFLRRRLQVPGYVEAGKALFTGLMMVDAVVVDPTAGSMPPIVYATLHV